MENHKVALITGASRGLGLELARLLARRGFKLALVARGTEALEAAAAGLKTEVLTLPGDVSQVAEQLVEKTLKRFGRLDYLVNNASTVGLSPMPPLADYPWYEIEKVLRVNALAPLHLTQLALPHLAPDGAILNVTSDAGVEAYPGWGGYGASKATLEHFTRTLVAEHPQRRIYLVDPTDMNTQMHREAEPGVDLSHLPGPEMAARFLEHLLLDGEQPAGRFRATPLGRQVEPALS